MVSMRVNYFSKLLFAVSAMAIVLSGCGGGGGGGGSSSGGDAYSYMSVTSVTPAVSATSVDARVEAVTANFSADLDVSAFITQGTALGKLLASHTPAIRIQNVSTGVAVDTSNMTLADLVSGKYSATVKVNGTDTIAVLDSYEFVPEASGDYGLNIYLLNQPQATVKFTSTELLTSGVINNDLFVVKNNKTGKNVFGQITAKGRTVSFYPVKSLDWSASYTVTISNSVKDTSGRFLKYNYTWSFDTQNIPNPAITNATPIGIDASPIRKIYVQTNFVVNPASLVSGTVVLNKLVRVSATDIPTKTPVDVALSYDSATSQIVIAPKADLDYLQEYEVVVKGAGGVSGSLGNVSGISLQNDYTWSFTTGEPKVIKVDVSPLIATAASNQLLPTISIDLNFRPNPSTVLAGITLTDSAGQSLAFDYKVQDGNVSLVPKANLKYGSKYYFTITSGLKSINNALIYISESSPWNFTTPSRQIISVLPSANSSGNSPNAEISVGFNFEPANIAYAADSAYFIVEQQTNGGVYNRVAGTYSYDSVKKVISFFPNSSFLYNAQIRVSISGALPAKDGATLGTSAQSVFTIRNETLAMSTTVPTNGSTDVKLDTPISVRLSYPIDYSSFSSSALTMRDCNYRTIPGRVTMDTDTLYFMPSQALDSFCKHTVTVDSTIRGTHNEKQSGTNSWSFTTDGLRVTNVYVTYAYGDFVNVNQPLEVTFNHSIGYVYSGDIYLVDSHYNRISGTSYSSGSSVKFYPSSQLKYGEYYKLVVSSSIKGALGEKLSSDDYTYFYTENLPVDVVDYGPTGTAFVDDYFWVDMSYTVGTQGFPDYSRSSLLPYAGVSMSNDGKYLIYMRPYNYLSYSTTYKVTFDFAYSRNYGNSFDFSWYVNTVSRTSASASPYVMRAKALAATGDFTKRGCRANKECVGSLRTTNLLDYKKAIAGNRQVNLKSPAVKARVDAIRNLNAAK